MIQKLVMGFVISFVMRQLEKFRESIDWDLIKKDLDDRVRQMMPGSWFDDEAVIVVNAAVDLMRSALEQGNTIKHLLELLSAQKYDVAMTVIKDCVMGKLSGTNLSSTETAIKDSMFMV